MRFLDTWTDVITWVPIRGRLHEVCASAVAHHDESSHELVLYCHSFARLIARQRPNEYAYPAWLPASDVIRAVCATEKAHDVAAQLFGKWKKHVLSHVPQSEDLAIAAGRGDDELWCCTGSD